MLKKLERKEQWITYGGTYFFSECVNTMDHSAKSFASFMTSVLLVLIRKQKIKTKKII